MLRLISLLLCASSVLAETCELPVSSSSPGIFWRKLNSYHLLLDNNFVNGIAFDERIEINGVCRNGFRKLESYESIPPRHISVSCPLGKLHFSTLSSIKRKELHNLQELECPNAATFFEASVPGCKSFYGLTYGFLVEPDIPVSLANVCYDLDQMQPRFVQYLAATRNHILEDQIKLNLARLNSISKEVVLEPRDLDFEDITLENALGSTIHPYEDVAKFNMKSILPLHVSLGVMGQFTYDLTKIIAIPWWTPLSEGNWNLIEKAIADIATTNVYDVYAGTSHVVTYSPPCEECEDETLTYEIDEAIRPFPLYVWNYIKKRYPGSEDGVFIIGVNSPFFDATKHVICEDICDTIEWLKHLTRERKMAALGYVFCCRPHDVKDTLENLPSFLKDY